MEQPDGIERAERSPHAAPLVVDSGAGTNRFVRVSLATAAAVLLAVGVANLAIDPLATFGTGLVRPVVFSDHAERLPLVDRLPAPPEVVILGSSRALKAEPGYLASRTGLRGFNAATSNGKAEDGFAYAHLFHDRYPDTRIRHVWFLEVEAFRHLPASPQLLAKDALARHFPASLRGGSRLDDIQRLFEWGTVKSSVKALRWAATGRRPGNVAELAADGFRVVDAHDRSERAGVPFETRLAVSIGTARSFIRGIERDGLAPQPRRYFEEAIAAMNSWHSEPVIVLGPVHPDYRRALGPAAYDRLNALLDAYLTSLAPRLRFTVVDARDLASFGGSPAEFYDGIHLRLPNMRLLLDLVAREAGPALQ